MDFIGRDVEIRLLKERVVSGRAELGVVYGRRRVGKSALLKRLVKRSGDYYFEGLQRASGKKQITHFMDQLAGQTGTMRVLARDWKEAFQALSVHIAKGSHYVVFDEFPWMAAGRTELVALLKYFWDNVWKQNRRLTVVLCGSVASFMVKHVIHSQALHNRKTFEIKLDPLPAIEAKRFFKSYRSDFEILKFMMVFGGIPKYLELVDPRKSLSANVDALCLNKNAFFLNEYETLFKEQFKVIRYYSDIVETLAKKSLSQEDLAGTLGKKTGGGLTQYVENLERADFVRKFSPYVPAARGRPHRAATSEGKTYRIYLWDEWLRFYFTYVKPRRRVIAETSGSGLFDGIVAKSFDNYCGLAFERLCLKNIATILGRLDLDMSRVEGFGPFFRQPGRKGGLREPGLQIDILVELKGRVLLVVECKFSVHPIGVSVIKEIDRKISELRAPRIYSTERILIAPGGITDELAQSRYFHRVLGSEAVLGL